MLDKQSREGQDSRALSPGQTPAAKNPLSDSSPRAVTVYSDATLTKAVGLLSEPAKPATIRMFDPTKAKGDPERLRLLIAGAISGVTEVGGDVINMSSRGRWYRAAAEGDAFALHAFASEVAHERAHTEGLGERDARQIEVFGAFVNKGLVERGRGERSSTTCASCAHRPLIPLA